MNKNHGMLKGLILTFSKLVNKIGLGFCVHAEGLCVVNLMIGVVLSIRGVPSGGSVLGVRAVA